jgi:hypothetical protein
MTDYVLVPKFCQLTGYTDDAVRAKISQGKWREGTVWRKAPDGRVLISITGYEAWVEGREYGQSDLRPSRSISDGRARGAANVLGFDRRPPTFDTSAT